MKALVRLDCESSFGMQAVQGAWGQPDGHFEIPEIARTHVTDRMLLRVHAPGFVETSVAMSRDELTRGDLRLTIVRGRRVIGRFVDEDGRPVAGPRFGGRAV